MKTRGPKRLVRAIINNPRSSVQDALLLSSVMIVATLLALEFDLFNFAGQLTVPQRRITLAEAIFLTLLLALCIFAFVIRRLRGERQDVVRRVSINAKLRELKALALQELADRAGKPSCTAVGVSGNDGLSFPRA